MTLRLQRDNRGRARYHPPRKPERIDQDCFWASVETVVESDGFGPHEKTWACEIMGASCPSDAAHEAAEGWFDDTDQCGECEVVIRIERFDGVVSLHRLRIAPSIVVTEAPFPEAGGAS